MRKVYIVGTGATPVAEHWDRSAASLASEALVGALRAVGPDRVEALYVANALSGPLGGQSQLASTVATAAGMVGVEAHAVEAGGASGGAALRQAYLAIAGGSYDVVAVVGVEKATDVLEPRLEAALALQTDVDWEAVHGVTLSAQWAMLMRRYMHEHGYEAADFAPFPVNAHANGAANAQALYRFPITLDKVLASSPVCEPLSLLDCSTAADGAAALLLVSEGMARELSAAPVRIAGSAVATDSIALFQRPDPLWLAGAARSAATALRMAKLAIKDVDVLELTDPHGITAVLGLEACGFAERGAGVRLGQEGAIVPTGATPLATAGGYKARGDAGGASGVYQVVELVRQLRGEAGKAQVPGAAIGLAQCLGGVGATAATHVLTMEQ